MNTVFERFKAIADKESNGNPILSHTILKEVLHWDILSAISRSGLGKSLVFQGGTALRLCYNNPRYSEDLDFVRVGELQPAQFDVFKRLLTDAVINKYQLDIDIKDPNKSLELRSTDESIAVHRWTATIEIEGRGVRNQKLHIEVADIPSHDYSSQLINSPYEPYGLSPLFLNVSSKKEILADKIVAIADRPYLKGRDIWDLKWLAYTNAQFDPHLVLLKCQDYNMLDDKGDSHIIEKLKNKLVEIANPSTEKKFIDEMSRFMSKDLADVWLRNDGPINLFMSVSDYLEQRFLLLKDAEQGKEQSDQLRSVDDIKKWRDRLSKVNDLDR